MKSESGFSFAIASQPFQWEIGLEHITWEQLVLSETYQRQNTLKFQFQFRDEQIDPQRLACVRKNFALRALPILVNFGISTI